MFRRNKQIYKAKQLNAYGLTIIDENELMYDEVVGTVAAITIKEIATYIKHNPGTEIDLSNTIRLK